MADSGEVGDWAGLIPDVLGRIFRNLELEETLTVVPRVCKSWQCAVSGPYCWKDIDLVSWSYNSNPEELDRMLQMLIIRSSGTCRSISVSGLHTDPTFTFIAEHAHSLERLKMIRSEISNSVVQQVASSFSNITFLDLSYCGRLGASALEAFGKNCKFLAELRRRIRLLDLQDECCHEEEAKSIASTMAKLRRLVIPQHLLTKKTVLEILSGCKDLEYLDLSNCWDVELDEGYLMEHHPGLKVLGPVTGHGQYFWDECSDSSYSSVYSYDYQRDDDGIDESLRLSI